MLYLYVLVCNAVHVLTIKVFLNIFIIMYFLNIFANNVLSSLCVLLTLSYKYENHKIKKNAIKKYCRLFYQISSEQCIFCAKMILK